MRVEEDAVEEGLRYANCSQCWWHVVRVDKDEQEENYVLCCGELLSVGKSLGVVEYS